MRFEEITLRFSAVLLQFTVAAIKRAVRGARQILPSIDRQERLVMKDKKAAAKNPMLLIAAQGSVLTLTGTIAGKCLSFLLRFIVIRLLGAKWFGYYAIAMALVEFARIVASIGLPRGGMRFLAMALASDEKEKLPQVITTALVIPCLLSILCSLLLFLSADIVANFWFHDQHIANILRLFSVTVPFAALLKVGCELSRGFLTTRYAVLVENFLVPVAQLCLFVILYFLRHDFNALIYGTVLSYGFGCISMLFFLSRQLRKLMGYELLMRPRWQWLFDKGKGMELIRYSFPLFLSGVTVILMNYIDIFMIGRFVGAEDVGVYVAASMVANFISSSLVIPVNSIFVPLVAARHGCKDIAAISHLYVATTRWLFIFSVPLIACVILGRKNIMWIFGAGFVDDGAMVLLILAIGHLVNCLAGGVGHILSMTGHPQKELIINIFVVILNIVLNLVLIPQYGILGAAVATSAAMVLVNVLRMIVVYMLFKMQPFAGKLVVIFIVGFFLISGNILFQEFVGWDYDLFSSLATCIVVTTIIVVRGLEFEDKELLREICKRAFPPRKSI